MPNEDDLRIDQARIDGSLALRCAALENSVPTAWGKPMLRKWPDRRTPAMRANRRTP